ncbi:MAG: FtsB family cell division protein [Sphingomonas oligoaromativorans]|jgi:cell division protein FtsB|uniref:FtsB family cell division protein n=1 Tax=Sphingomonas oligoaromativorans TaxID=575322 RepID=UPI0014240095|nr:septum formation initiator family protein [Sphingomonas oligoaromativorans]NIJ32110.1 cell division protein FtsB [Sphingomonas oligoaromativorans]
MRRGRSISIIRAAAAPALALLVIGNFAGYAIAGPNGLLALGDYKQQLAQRQVVLKQVEAQRAVLAHRVALLDAKHVDPDMADELVRRDMGLARPDEVIIPTP